MHDYHSQSEVTACDTDLDFTWQSRESDALLHADMLSRMKESSERL